MTISGQPWEYRISIITILGNKACKRLCESVISLLIVVCCTACTYKPETKNVSHDFLLQIFDFKFDDINEAITVIENKCYEIRTLMPDGSADYQLFVSGSSHNDSVELRNIFSNAEWEMMQNLFAELQLYSDITVSCYYDGIYEYAIELHFWAIDSNGNNSPLSFIFTPFGYPSAIMDYVMFNEDLCIPLEHHHWYKLVRHAPSN